jgi:hypothetical protein
MMRLRALCPMILLTLMALLSGCDTAPQTPAAPPTPEPTVPALEQIDTVEGPANSFSFRYPAGWVVQPSPDNTAVVLFNDPALLQGEAIDFGTGQAGIALSLLPAEAVSDDGGEVRLSDLLNVFSGGSPGVSARVTEFEIDGKQGVSVLAATDIAEAEQQIEVLFMLVDLNDPSSSLVLATVQAVPGQTARYETLARQIAASVQVNSGSAG